MLIAVLFSLQTAISNEICLLDHKRIIPHKNSPLWVILGQTKNASHENMFQKNLCQVLLYIMNFKIFEIKAHPLHQILEFFKP